MDPRLFLVVAQNLANSNLPAESRTSIGRSYYAAYNVAVSFLEELGIQPLSGAQGHTAVKNGLLASNDQTMVKAGSDLDTLHVERRRADYFMNDPRPENRKTAQALYRQSGKLIADVDACRLSPQRRGQVQTSIKQWVTKTPHAGLRII